jgi:AcrR family transcriptional regulator
MDTRDRLFAAARDLFAEKGLEGLSVRAVAVRAGLSTMALYRHFADKDALLDALMQDGFAAWEARALAIDEPDPVVWLARLLSEYCDFALRDRHRFDAAFLLPASSARKYPRDMAAGRSPVVSAMLERIGLAQAERRMPAAAPAIDIATTLSALAQGLVSMERAGRFVGEDAFRSTWSAVVDLTLSQFASPAAPSPA